jgi:hypothetical protein
MKRLIWVVCAISGICLPAISSSGAAPTEMKEAEKLTIKNCDEANHNDHSCLNEEKRSPTNFDGSKAKEKIEGLDALVIEGEISIIHEADLPDNI